MRREKDMPAWIKYTISVFSICTVLFLGLNKAGELARSQDFDSDVWTNYYAEEDNTINTVLIGSSSMYRYWIPTQAYEEQGYTSMLIGTAAQDIRLAPYLMEEAAKTQDLDLFVVEVRSIIIRGDVTKIKDEHYNYRMEVMTSGMRPSSTKFEMIQKYYRADEKSKFELMFPILKYHDNLLTFDRQVLIDRLNQGTDEFKTGRQRSKITKIKEPVFESDGQLHLSDETLGYIDDIETKAEELGVKVLLVATPYYPSKGQASKQLQLDEYIASKGYDYLNMNNVLDELNLEYSTDFYNSKHVNIAGAKKVTTYLAQYIEDNYGLQSKLTDEQKQSWTDACDAWADEEISLMAEWEKYKKENE